MRINEITLYIIALVWFIFITINVNPSLGQVYTGFTIGAMLLYLFDTKKTIAFDKDGKWDKALLQAGIIYIAFTIASVFLINFLEKINIGGVISLLGATTPALAASVILNFMTFSIPVAFVETMFFIRITDFFASRFNIKTDKQGLFSLAGIILVLIFAFGFLMYHVTAKGIANNSALMLTFIMMAVSLGVAFWYQESKQAVLFHIIANTIASIAIFGLFVISLISVSI